MTLPILVLYNEPTLPADHPDADSEHDILYTADTVTRILQGHGYQVRRLGLGADPAPLLAALADPPAAVFNLYEGLAQWGNTEVYIAGLLELAGVPFTGSPPQPLMVCRSKPLTKQLLAGAGLPTAPFFVVEGDGPIRANPLGWPVIVKPGREDASVGIDQGSVVTTQAELEARVKSLRERYGPTVLVEAFIRGREFNVALALQDGILTTLPFSEILFEPPPEAAHLWPIVSFDAKWRPDTLDFVATPAKNPADVTPELCEAVSDLSHRAFALVGCRDYARVDFRVNEAGQPYILEVNPNPCISPLAGLAAALESAKMAYSDFVLGLVSAALARAQTPQAKPTPTAQPGPRLAGKPRGVRVRPMTDADQLRLQSVTGEPALQTVLELTSDSRDDQAMYSVLVERTLAGVAVVDGPRDGVATLRGAFVLPEFRRRGAGEQLVRAVLDFAASRNARWVQCHTTTAPHDAVTRQFLSQTGWRPAGDLPDFTRDGYARLTFAHPVPAKTTGQPALPTVTEGIRE